MKMQRTRALVLLLVLVLALSGCMLPANEPVRVALDMTAEREAPVAGPLAPPALTGSRALENTICYMEQGGAAFVCGSGGSITLESGASLIATSAPIAAQNIEVGGGFGGGYAAGSGCSLTAAGALLCDGKIYTRNTLGVTGALTTTTTADFGGAVSAATRLNTGGGYGAGGGGTGCELSAAGDVECDGKGYFGSTLGVTGALTTTTTARFGGAVTADTRLNTGGGYGAGGGGTGCELSAAGDVECDGKGYFGSTLGVTGALTTTTTARFGGAVTADTRLNTGGGYGAGGGSTGCELSAAGDVECDGKAYFGSTLGVTGAVTTTTTMDVGGTLNYGANNLYALGHATSGKAVVAGVGVTAVDGSYAVVHGLTGVDAVQVSICQKPTATVLIPAAVITMTSVTIHAYDVAVSSAANGANLCYTVIGTR